MGETKEYRVDVTCKNERIDVAAIKTTGPLDVKAIRSGAFAIDGARFPYAKLEDAAAIRCGRCGGSLYFRLADGSLHEAIPGALKVEG